MHHLCPHRDFPAKLTAAATQWLGKPGPPEKTAMSTKKTRRNTPQKSLLARPPEELWGGTCHPGKLYSIDENETTYPGISRWRQGSP